eukprot:7338072-Prymnesium_polylepis.1
MHRVGSGQMLANRPHDEVVWYFSFGPNVRHRSPHRFVRTLEAPLAVRWVAGGALMSCPRPRPQMSKTLLKDLLTRSSKDNCLNTGGAIMLPGVLKGQQLAFTLMGYEGCEPRFANLVPYNSARGSVEVNPECNGIAHRLTAGELLALDDIEGEGYGFRRIQGTFQPYYDDGEGVREVFTYVALPYKVASAGAPSRRYLDLLVRAAASSGLAPEYVEWLRAQPTASNSGRCMPAPSLSERRRLITPAELASRAYVEGDPPSPAWVVLGGQVFDLNAHSVAHVPSPREPMLRRMAFSQDCTLFVLSVLERAYPEERPTSAAGKVSTRQREYLAAWATFLLANGCPRVGVLEGQGWEDFMMGHVEAGT